MAYAWSMLILEHVNLCKSRSILFSPIHLYVEYVEKNNNNASKCKIICKISGNGEKTHEIHHISWYLVYVSAHLQLENNIIIKSRDVLSGNAGEKHYKPSTKWPGHDVALINIYVIRCYSSPFQEMQNNKKKMQNKNVVSMIWYWICTKKCVGSK